MGLITVQPMLFRSGECPYLAWHCLAADADADVRQSNDMHAQHFRLSMLFYTAHCRMAAKPAIG